MYRIYKQRSALRPDAWRVLRGLEDARALNIRVASGGEALGIVRARRETRRRAKRAVGQVCWDMHSGIWKSCQTARLGPDSGALDV
jgi:hypothetical protein